MCGSGILSNSNNCNYSYISNIIIFIYIYRQIRPFWFIRIGNKYNWKVTDIIENLYRINNPEVIVNGELIETNLSTETVNKTLSKIYRDYRFITMKESIKLFINRICGNNI